MPRKTQTVTIQDVAKNAGVSVSTISRVLNNKADVSVETQQHVLDVINTLGYSTNLAARSMRSMHTNIIGLIVPDVEFPYSLEVLKGINRVIASSEYDLLIYTTGSYQKQDTAMHEQQYVSRLNGTITDGVIVVTPSAPYFITDAPIVSIDPHVLIEKYPSVYCDHYQGAMEAMLYLIRLNHRRIAYISGRQGQQNKERYTAYCDALEQSGIGVNPELVVEGDYSIDTGMECARRLLGMENRPTAIFAANDQSAMGVVQAAKAMGCRIPDDLSLVGFDNIPEAAYLGLTTVDQRLVEMGTIAVEMLISLIEGKGVEKPLLKIPANLVVRQSCQALSL